MLVTWLEVERLVSSMEVEVAAAAQAAARSWAIMHALLKLMGRYSLTGKRGGNEG